MSAVLFVNHAVEGAIRFSDTMPRAEIAGDEPEVQEREAAYFNEVFVRYEGELRQRMQAKRILRGARPGWIYRGDYASQEAPGLLGFGGNIDEEYREERTIAWNQHGILERSSGPLLGGKHSSEDIDIQLFGPGLSGGCLAIGLNKWRCSATDIGVPCPGDIGYHADRSAHRFLRAVDRASETVRLLASQPSATADELPRRWDPPIADAWCLAIENLTDRQRFEPDAQRRWTDYPFSITVTITGDSDGDEPAPIEFLWADPKGQKIRVDRWTLSASAPSAGVLEETIFAPKGGEILRRSRTEFETLDSPADEWSRQIESLVAIGSNAAGDFDRKLAAALASTAELKGPQLDLNQVLAPIRPRAEGDSARPGGSPLGVPKSIEVGDGVLVVHSFKVGLGDLPHGASTEFDVTFENHTSSPLSIDRFDPDFGCAVLSGVELQLAPGQSATLLIRQTVRQLGPQIAKVRFRTSSLGAALERSNPSEHALEVHFKGLEAAVLENRLIDLGVCAPGQDRTGTVAVLAGAHCLPSQRIRLTGSAAGLHSQIRRRDGSTSVVYIGTPEANLRPFGAHVFEGSLTDECTGRDATLGVALTLAPAESERDWPRCFTPLSPGAPTASIEFPTTGELQVDSIESLNDRGQVIGASEESVRCTVVPTDDTHRVEIELIAPRETTGAGPGNRATAWWIELQSEELGPIRLYAYRAQAAPNPR